MRAFSHEGDLFCASGNTLFMYNWDAHQWGVFWTASVVIMHAHPQEYGIVVIVGGKHMLVSYARKCVTNTVLLSPGVSNVKIAMRVEHNKTVARLDHRWPPIGHVSMICGRDRTMLDWNFFAYSGAAAATLHDGRGIVTGGLTSRRTPTTIVQIIDPETNALSTVRGMLKQRVDHHQTVLGNGDLLVVGGCKEGDGEIYSPGLNIWNLVSVDGAAVGEGRYVWVSKERGLVYVPFTSKSVTPVEMGAWWTPKTHQDCDPRVRKRVSATLMCLARREMDAYGEMIAKSGWQTRISLCKKK